MTVGHTSTWDSLEQWSPALFLGAGGVLTIYAALTGLEAFFDIAVQRKGFEFGYVLGFLGLLGLFPRLADRTKWLARAGAIAAALGAFAFSVFTIVRLAELAGLGTGDPPAWAMFVVLAAGGFIVGYFSFGIAHLRGGQSARLVGIVLLIPGVIIVLMLAHIAAGLNSPATAFVVSAGQAMAHLAVGVTLNTRAPLRGKQVATEGDDQPALTHE